MFLRINCLPLIYRILKYLLLNNYRNYILIVEFYRFYEFDVFMLCILLFILHGEQRFYVQDGKL